jgi:hypothetical protein
LFVFLLFLFYFSDRVLPLGETYRHGWRKAKIATQSIHTMLCYFNGFVYRLSFCCQGQHFDIIMDNVDMVYMNIMICWNIIMVMCIYFGLVRDSSAVWRLLRTCCSRGTSEGYTYGKQRDLPLQLLVGTFPRFCLLPFSKWRPITSHKVGQRSIKHMILS